MFFKPLRNLTGDVEIAEVSNIDIDHGDQSAIEDAVCNESQSAPDIQPVDV